MPVSPSDHTSSRIPDSEGGPALQPLRKNQRQQILELLTAACGKEVPSAELAKVSLQYGARVSELREMGFVVINRVEINNGMKQGFFRLLQCPAIRPEEKGKHKWPVIGSRCE